MMKKGSLWLALVLGVVTTVSGCAKRPPKCSNSDTKDALAGIYVRQFAGIDENRMSDKDVLDYITVHSVKKIDYERENNKYQCEAIVQFGDDGGLRTTYESYFSEETGEHMVAAQGLFPADQMTIATYVRWQIERLKNKDAEH
jgi:hypothetical protein